MKNIILTGFMGTGKTAVGREIARILQMNLIDIDAEIEKSEKMTINSIFEQFGETRFREIETEMIKKKSGMKNVVISTGGGAVLKQENMKMLRENGVIVCLRAAPETILRRTGSSEDRPLLKVDDPLQKIHDLMNAREPFYEKADIMIDTEDKTPLQIAEEIIDRVRMV